MKHDVLTKDQICAVINEFKQAQTERGSIHILEQAVFIEETFGITLPEDALIPDAQSPDRLPCLIFNILSNQRGS